ncbi:hypothetical protein BG418_23980 [Streptomyces sp. CBMA152]|nr:hypothetical protein [Streptomyces sp. CBMA152]
MNAAEEWARHWQYPGLPGLDLLRARYVSHSFARHSHEGQERGPGPYGEERARTYKNVEGGPP